MGVTNINQGRRLISAVLCQLGFVVCYWLSAKLGLTLATINANTSPVWPATGIALSIVYIFGYRSAFAIWIGAYLANLGTGLDSHFVGLIATGNTLEAITGVYLFRKMSNYWRDHIPFYGNVVRYSGLAFVPSVISATFGTGVLFLAGVINQYSMPITWITWWVGDALGCFFVFPLAHDLYQRRKNLTDFSTKFVPRRALLQLLAIGSIVGFSWIAFATNWGQPFLLLIFFGFLLTALWLPYWGTYVSAIYITGFAIIATNYGLGPFCSAEKNASLLHLEFFLSSVWLTVIVLNNLREVGLLKNAIYAFSLGWISTAIVFYVFYQNSLIEKHVQIERRIKSAANFIQANMDSYVRLLQAGAGFVHGTQDKLTSDRWKSFAEGLGFTENYPGLKGMGIIYRIKKSETESFENKIKKQDRAFQVRELKSTEKPSPPHDFRYVITYVEPKERNYPAVGLDIASEFNRYSAAVRARDSNAVAMTKDIRLVQSDQSVGVGYLLLLPLYKSNTSYATVEARNENLFGFVYAPIEGAQFFSSASELFGPDLELVRFQTSPIAPPTSAPITDLAYDRIVLGGVDFFLQWRLKNIFLSSGSMAASLAGFCGAFFTLVLALLVAGLDGLGNEAKKIANAMNSQLKQREQLWRSVTELSPVGLFLTDQLAEITYINGRFSEITGLSLEEVKNGMTRDSVVAAEKDRVLSRWDDFVSGKANSYSENYRIRTRDGLKYISSQAVAIKSDDGETLGFLGALQDLTEVEQSQMALARSARLSSLGQMAGGIAHEINTPLTVISAKSEVVKRMLEKGIVDKSQLTEQLDKIQKTVHRIAKIVRGLRMISREPSNEMPTFFEVKPVILDTIELCDKRFEDAEISFKLNFNSIDQIKVLGHPEQLGQALLNLLNNSYDAVKSTPSSWIQLNGYVDNGKFKMEVVDSGHISDPEILEKIFNPFFTTKEVGQGTGLGLSLSKAMVEKWGGDLYFDQSKSNTTFTIELKIDSDV